MKSYNLQFFLALFSIAIGAVRTVGRWLTRHRPRLIPGWRHGWRMLSVQAAGLLVIVNTLQQALQAVDFALPPDWLPPINATLGTAVILLRLLDQPKLRAAVDAMLGPGPADQIHAAAEAATAPSAAGGETAAPVAGGVAPLTPEEGRGARPPFDPYDGRWR